MSVNMTFSFSSLVVYDLAQVLGLNRQTNELITAAQLLLTDEHSARRRKILGDLLCNLKENADMENRDDDKDWFEGTYYISVVY